jgi:hypothetical protein
MDNQPTPIRPMLLKPHEAAAELQVCTATVYNMMKATPPQIPFVFIRGKRRIPAAALEAMIARQMQEAGTA